MHSQTKPYPNVSTTLILKARGPRRGARDPEAPVLSYVAQLWRLATVTTLLVHGPQPEQNHPMLIEQLQRYRQDVGACSMVGGPWYLVPGPRA